MTGNDYFQLGGSAITPEERERVIDPIDRGNMIRLLN